MGRGSVLYGSSSLFRLALHGVDGNSMPERRDERRGCGELHSDNGAQCQRQHHAVLLRGVECLGQYHFVHRPAAIHQRADPAGIGRLALGGLGTGWVGASSCTPSSGSGTTVTCQTVTTGPTLVASCTAQAATSGNSYTQTTCSTATVSAATPVASCTAVAPSASNNYVGTYCNTVTTGPTTVSSCTAAAASSSNNWTATTCSGASTSGGTSNTLADVAEYYYKTDLRDSSWGNDTGALGTSVSTNNVPTSGADAASWQHMTTFTLGLGARGRMIFQSNYQSATSGDYYAVKNGLTANSSTGVCSWQSNGTICN